jgi:hypothetical protein
VTGRLVPQLAAGLLLASLALPGQASTGPAGELRFEVLLDGEPIGYHRFRIDDSGETRVVESEASFDVRVLFIPVYRYRHQNTEVWRDGCLAEIRSQTDANGEQFEVRGERAENAFRLQTQGDTLEVRRDCPMTFAYWNRDFLAQRQLINSQTGELVGVEVRPVGQGSVTVGDRQVAAEGYRLENPDEGIDILVWYAASDGRWLSLETSLANGRAMRYVPADPERLALGSPASAMEGGGR